MLRVAIIGLGTVGNSVVNLLEKNKDIIKARSGKEIVPIVGVVRDISKNRNNLSKNIDITDNLDEVLLREDIDVYVELIGGVDKAYEVVKKALARGKSVVTANKALLAYHRYDLQEVANGVCIGFEASVGGGIPIIKTLREGLSANQIETIKGIMNGTCNYILTKMMDSKICFNDVLREAQILGYAEADPTFDVGGFDTAHKLLILASIAYGIDAKPEDILIEGIDRISAEDIYFAKEFEYNIKLLGIAKKRDNFVELRVHPTLVPKTQMISRVDGVMNGISVVGDFVGETMYYGPGAGGNATASAVVADLVDIARDSQNSPMLGFKKPLHRSELNLLNIDNIVTKYYIRVKVKDEIGVLAKIANVLGEYSISVDALLQKPEVQDDDIATLLFSTHECCEADIQGALFVLESLDFILEKPMMIRIED